MPRAQLFLGGVKVEEETGNQQEASYYGDQSTNFQEYGGLAIVNPIPVAVSVPTHIPAVPVPTSPMARNLSYVPYHTAPPASLPPSSPIEVTSPTSFEASVVQIPAAAAAAPPPQPQQQVPQVQPLQLPQSQYQVVSTMPSDVGLWRDVTLFKQIHEKMGTTWVDHQSGLYLSNVETDSAAQRCGVGTHIGQRLTHINNIPVRTVHDVLALRSSSIDYAHGTQTLILRFANEEPISVSLDQRPQAPVSPLMHPAVPTPLPMYQNTALSYPQSHDPQALISSPVYDSTVPVVLPPPASVTPSPMMSIVNIPSNILADDVLIEKKPGEALGCVLEEMILKSVAEGSPAGNHGLQQYIGDKLTHINGKLVTRLEDVRVIGTDARLWLRFQSIGEQVALPPAMSPWSGTPLTFNGQSEHEERVSASGGWEVPLSEKSEIPEHTSPFEDFTAALNRKDIPAVLGFFRPTSMLRHFDVTSTSLTSLRGTNLGTYFTKLFSNLPLTCHITIQGDTTLPDGTTEGLAIWDPEPQHYGSLTVIMEGTSVLRYCASMSLDVLTD
eukprot:TRINITY_DN12661_c0_g2_i1.p1 TRINITY_DN12661_c0_g2~~TRINITY_DN12661_c0_g2_i1.p1  ORF type:complete len:554 (+),score=104.68 TRINITY_DN12661_c0_g2_i1:63-1724(+)